MHMNSREPISITDTPGSLWKCGTTWSAMVLSCGRHAPGNLAAQHSGRRCLDQDDFSSNRHPGLALCLRGSFFTKPVPGFAGVALGAELWIGPVNSSHC